jgi:hypothetical protein
MFYLVPLWVLFGLMQVLGPPGSRGPEKKIRR